MGSSLAPAGFREVKSLQFQCLHRIRHGNFGIFHGTSGLPQGLGALIAQRDAVEAQLARGALERDAAFVGFDLAIEEAEDAFGSGEPALDRGVHAGQRLDPLEQR